MGEEKITKAEYHKQCAEKMAAEGSAVEKDSD